jgi:iron complex outermembrane recepter protein
MRWLSFILLAGVSTAALAAEAERADEEIVVTVERVPDAVFGAAGTATLIKDVPQGISVVPAYVIDVQQPLSLTDIVRNTPSVSNFRNGSETFRTLSVRGFVQNETTVDGLRNTDALNIQPDGLATIERVEVIRGPAAALYGRGSLGASVNIVTKKPQDPPAARLDLEAGSRDLLGGVADVTGPIGGGLGVRAIGAYEARDSFIDFIDVEAWQVAPSVAADLTDDTRLLAQLDYRERHQLRYIGLPRYGTLIGLDDLKLPIGANFGEPGLPETENTGLQATTILDHRVAADWTVQLAARFTRNTYDQEAVALRTLGADNRTLARSWNRFDEAQDEAAFFASTNVGFATGGVGHDLRVGLEHARFSYDSKFFSGRIASIDIANPVYGARPTGVFLLDDTTDRIEGTGLSVQDQVTLTPALKLLLGGRLDWIDTSRRSNLTSDRGRRDVSAFSPRVGATYDATPNVTLFASWGRNIEAQNNGGSNAALTPFEPIRGNQAEAGVKLSQGGRVAATLGVYRINATGVLTADPTPGSFFSVPTGRRRSQGAEAEVNWQPVEGLSLLGYVSYTDAEIRRDTNLAAGTPIQNVPEWAARLFALYEVPSGPLAGFSVNAGVTHQGDQPGNLAAAASRFVIPDSTIVDAGVAYRAGRVRVALQARNLFDRRHFIRGAFDGRNVVPGDPRSVILSIGYAWTAGR